MKFSEVLKISSQLIKQDAERDKVWNAYQDQYKLKLEYPKELKALPWFREATVTDPHDAIATGERTMAGGRVRLNFQPYIADAANRQRANEIEQILQWHIALADTRKSVPTLKDMSKSALLYDAVACQVIDIDHQIMVSKALKKNPLRLIAAKSRGRFVLNCYLPKYVHVLRSSYGDEAVLLACLRPAADVRSEWGSSDLLDQLAATNEYVYYYDWWDMDSRGVWVAPGGAGSALNEGLVEGGGEVLLNPGWKQGKHGMPFIPWVTKMSGSDLEEEMEYKYHPMLYATHFSNSWKTMSLVRSLVVSEVLARSIAPVGVDEGPNQDSAVINYGDPTQLIKPAAGNTIRPFPKPPLDNAAMEIGDRFGNDIRRSTVTDILQGGQLPASVSYSALNLSTQIAGSQLRPAADLVQTSLAEVARLMLMWTFYTDIPLTAYNSDRRSEAYGKEYIIMPEDIDPTGLFITCEIDPATPGDRQQQANTNIMLVNNGLLPAEWAMEDLGINNTTLAKELIMKEKWLQHQQEMDMQLELQQAVSEQQANLMTQNQQVSDEAQNNAMVGAETGMPGGMAFNPAMGGLSPVQAVPGATSPIEAGLASGEIPEPGVF